MLRLFWTMVLALLGANLIMLVVMTAWLNYMKSEISRVVEPPTKLEIRMEI